LGGGGTVLRAPQSSHLICLPTWLPGPYIREPQTRHSKPMYSGVSGSGSLFVDVDEDGFGELVVAGTTKAWLHAAQRARRPIMAALTPNRAPQPGHETTAVLRCVDDMAIQNSRAASSVTAHGVCLLQWARFGNNSGQLSFYAISDLCGAASK